LRPFSVTIVLLVLQQVLPPSVIPELIPSAGPITLAIGQNKRVMSSYNISPRNGTIFIHKWNVVMEIRPHMKMGDTAFLFMYEGIAGIFLFIS
jgi:hypothetical protein